MTITTVPFAPFSGPDWTQEHIAELEVNDNNGRVGSRLVSETERVRVWHIVIKPGERLPFHRHVNDYFWTALTEGCGRSRHGDGTVAQVAYRPGDTAHYRFAQSESRFHDLENTGDTELVFVTVELLGGPNAPLPIAES
jgi:mannose-6-phosphate isomerase-like protein (cupin superfamily)